MWISRQIIDAAKRWPAAELTEVTGSAAMQGANAYRGVPMASSWGIDSLPPNSAQAVVVQTGSGIACIGVLSEDRGLEAGELLLYSAGGAEIYLKNSGEVVINGQVFAAKKEG